MKTFIKNLNHYIPLFGILVATLVGMAIFSSDRKFQEIIVIAASSGYLTWGVVHHIIHKDLTFAIVLEYFAVAVFGVVVVFSLLFRT